MLISIVTSLDMVMRSGKSFVAIELVKYWNCKSILILSDAIRTNNQWLSNLQNTILNY